MKITANCGTCGKPLKRVQIKLPAVILEQHDITPTESCCQHCGARGAIITEGVPEHGR